MNEFTVRVNNGRYEVDDTSWGTIGVDDPQSLRCALNYIEMLLVGLSPEIAFRKASYGLAAYIRETSTEQAER